MQESKEARQARYAKDPERAKEYHRVWREKNREKIAQYRAEERALKPAAYLFREARSRAKKQGVLFDLTASKIDELLLPMVCSATGLPLQWAHEGSGRSNPWAPSLDRLDGLLGYTEANVRIVCWAYNSAKSDWPADTVLKMAIGLVETHNGK